MKNCLWCKKEFKPKTSRQKFCNLNHKNYWYIKNIPSYKIKHLISKKKYYQKIKHTPEYKKRSNMYARKFKALYPEKHKARWAIQDAVRRGKIKKLPCVFCGEIKVHAHHDDYSKPLEVKWLCKQHHVDYHRGIIH